MERFNTSVLERYDQARELRQKAERYRYLAHYVGDERTVGIIKVLSCECDNAADQIERDLRNVMDQVPSSRTGTR